MDYRIAICEDCETDSKFVRGILDRWASDRGYCVTTEAFPSSESFLFRYAENKKFDILLLDIEMEGMNGVELASDIRKENDALQIVFITGYSEYVTRGYDVAALHYLLKPVSDEKLFPVLDRAAAALKKAERAVLFSADGEIIRVPANEIVFAEAFSHSVRVTAKRMSFEIKQSMSETEKLLGNGFVRCHRSYIVGLRHISRLSKADITLDSGKVIPMSRNSAPIVHRAFISYYTGDELENL